MNIPEARAITRESSSTSRSAESSSIPIWLGLVVAIGGAVVYWITAFPSISWWENAELATAACVLGVVHPPGALIPTIIGWLALKIPLGGSPAHLLNLLAGTVAGLVLLLAVQTVGRFWRMTENETSSSPVAEFGWAAPLAGLSFAFSQTFWSNGTLFTPYIFTALLTVSILLALLRWWREADGDAAWRWTFVVLLLFGLDISVHRTNMLLLPGVVIWAWLRKPSAFVQLRHWIAGAAGAVLGLSVHLLLLPMAGANPPLNSNDPSTLSRLWDYVSLRQYGGSFLVSVLPRKGDFWSVQLADYISGFRANFAAIDGPLGMVGLIPLLLGLIGAVALWRRCRRLAVGLIVLFLFTSLGAVCYFNLPANYFRAMDRHYLPSFVLFAVLLIYGAMSIARIVWRFRRGLLILAVGLLLTLGALAQATRNWPRLDSSRTYFAYDFGRNLMEGLPDRSILFVGSDIDTYSLWYLQMVEGERRDVTVANVSLLNTPWYLRQVMAEDTSLGFTMSADEIATHGMREWRDTTIAIPVPREFGARVSPTASASAPDTFHLHVPPTMQGRYIFGHDDIVVRLIAGNQWRRPIFFTTVAAAPQVGWVQPYLRTEGLVGRLMPVENPPVDTSILIDNLFSRYSYRGYADSRIVLEPPSRWVGTATLAAFVTLADGLADGSRCATLKSRMMSLLPPERVSAPEELSKKLETLCGGSPGR